MSSVRVAIVESASALWGPDSILAEIRDLGYRMGLSLATTTMTQTARRPLPKSIAESSP